MDLTDLTIKQAHQGFKKKEFSARELALAYLKKIKQTDKDLNAYLSVAEESALSDAELADKKIASGNFSELTGIPCAIKDAILVEGQKCTLCVHRKGATRSFGPGRIEIPKVYRKIGQPIFIPGSMGTYSYVLVGTKKAEELSFASTAHGAGRLLSRSYAIKNLRPEVVRGELEKHDVIIKAGSAKGMLEEAPEAYKDINEVARVSHELGIGNLVVRLKPLAVMKG